MQTERCTPSAVTTICRVASRAITWLTAASPLTSGGPMLHIPFSAIAILAYGVIYFLLASLMEAEYINQSYPTLYVGFSMIAQLLVVAGVVLFALDDQRATPSFGAGFFRFSFSTLPSVSTSIQQFRRARREMVGFGASPSAYGSWRPHTISISRLPAMGCRIRHANPARPGQAPFSHLTSAAGPMRASECIIVAGGTAPSADPARARPCPCAHLLPICCALLRQRSSR